MPSAEIEEMIEAAPDTRPEGEPRLTPEELLRDATEIKRNIYICLLEALDPKIKPEFRAEFVLTCLEAYGLIVRGQILETIGTSHVKNTLSDEMIMKMLSYIASRADATCNRLGKMTTLIVESHNEGTRN